ncbi:hypothetical protein L226DRAFT_182948 [Lentinus tigrinus ALCF2SS1-7]|uniref:Blue (type 1) copper domain-containing protein n=1 Tax=Lentinus tigrinus ALCF2SS1-6 TaxID=1328759 RepID=A0A5C2SRB9_9APHY|nr:hypothetical protein L227DRAFT_125406 [Lentinus tigrinus ALCF2SS1-6]RPD79836.1 hypothetical protein L226DRAFT_182948 [Lentinus tigrinus ALCF2SS1-7]
MFATAFSLALLPLLAAANPQYGYAPPAANPTTQAAAVAPSAPPSTNGQINIDVGAGGNFVFSPTNVTASNGTLVTFFFPAGATPHSVTQGDFANPCQPLAAQGGNSAGFDSGLQNSVQWTLNVTNDQIPIYFFCKAPTHCGLGMVGSINAPSSGNTFDAWQAAAVKVGASEQTLQDNGPVTGGVGAVATATPAATASGSSGSGSSGSSGGSSGAMRVSASGALATVFGVALAMLFAA